MNAILKNFLPLSALAAAAIAAWPVLAAEGDDAATLVTLSSEVSFGLGAVSKDNQRFGQYTGLKDNGGYGLLDVDYIQRDEATGTWLKLNGHNLGLDNRELRFEHDRQGDWGYFIDYSQIPRFDPFTVTTQLSGVGTTTQALIGNATPSEYHLKTEREILKVGADKTLSPGVELQVRVKNEEKDGARLWGQGTFSTWRFLTDPIDQTTRQVEVTLNHTGKRLQFSGGYYGTWFNNKNSALTVNGASVVFSPMALPPDNSSHQFHFAGGYSFSNTTRGTFKIARGQITQEDAFPTVPVVARSDLGGRIDTSLVQLGLTAKPIPKLSLRADLNYQNRDDKTPVLLYWPSQTGATSTNDGTNEPRDIRTMTGKLEAAYRLPMGYRLKGGIEFEEKKRNSPPVRSVNFRETTEETTYNIELRRSISETVTGAVSLLHSKRDGSEWLPMVNNGGSPTDALVAPLHLIDRDRDTVRLTVNWMPSDPLSLNFRLDESRDDYTGRRDIADAQTFDLGPRKGGGSNYSLDAAYLFSKEVTGTAWYSRNENQYENALCRDDVANVCNATDARPVWGADLNNIADSFGLGLRAKTSAKLEIGADLTASKVRDEMTINSISPTNSSAVTPLPDIHTKVTTLKLYGKYMLDRSSGIRVDFIHDRYKTDDWTWANWTYTTSVDGGTTVLQDPDQKVNFIGVSYYFSWK
jgi:MtrB/PioB family decaheme-associated outer membrane protein